MKSTLDRSIDRVPSAALASDSQPPSTNLGKNKSSPIDNDSESSGQENEDLKFATSRNENVVLELSIDGLVRHLSSNWEDVVGYVKYLRLLSNANCCSELPCVN